MRKSDKKKNLQKVNLLAEQRYLQSKGIITEMFSGPEIDIDGITTSLVRTTLHGGDDSTVYLRAKETLVDSNNQVKGEFYTMLANKMEANNLSNQAQQYRSIAQQYTIGSQSELEEEYISEAEGTDLEYITFSVNGEAYRPSKVINTSEASNSFTVEFGLDKYDKDSEKWVPIGGMLTYYFDMDTRADKLLFTDGRFGETIDAKKEIDTRYGLYEKIKQYVETRL